MSSFTTPTGKKLRFRGDFNYPGRIDDIFEDSSDRRRLRNGDIAGDDNDHKKDGMYSY